MFKKVLLIGTSLLVTMSLLTAAIGFAKNKNLDILGIGNNNSKIVSNQDFDKADMKKSVPFTPAVSQVNDNPLEATSVNTAVSTDILPAGSNISSGSAKASNNAAQVKNTKSSNNSSATSSKSSQSSGGGNTSAAAQPSAITTPEIDESQCSKGIIRVRYTNDSGKRMKIAVIKGGSKTYFNFAGNGSYESFPLQGGSGSYRITLYRNISGTSYEVFKSFDINVQISSEYAVYLSSNQMVNWANSSKAIGLARQLTSGLGSDEQKAKAIYSYVVKNIKYDINKLSTVSSGYIPNIDSVLNSRSGICFDFAAVYAGMLRSVGIPAKLVMGTSSRVNGYHSWNEVYINGRWVIVDTSYDSQARQAGSSYSMYKSSGDYNKTKQY